MNFSNTEVFNFKGAFRGMRNALESWDKSDSLPCWNMDCNICQYSEEDELDDNSMCKKVDYILGENDLKLAQKLILAGESHSKFMRQIFVSVDISAPLYWWKEMDQYRIGVTTNSESTMHRLAQTKITTDCFERNEVNKNDNHFLNFVNHLEELRKEYNTNKNKDVWVSLIQELPSSWLQMRTTTMSYANIRNIYKQRKHHKLSEWSVDFIEWVESLPYSKELIMLEKNR